MDFKTTLQAEEGKPATDGNSPTKPTATKSRYSSPLSSFRNNFKPPPGSPSSSFKPMGFSSPKAPAELPVDPIVNIESKQRDQLSPTVNPDTSNRGNSFINQLSLEGRGGEWRGPQQNDMQPEERNNKFRFRQNSSHDSGSPGLRNVHCGSPHDVIDNLNRRNSNRNNSLGQYNSPGFGHNNSYGQNNSYGKYNSSLNSFSPGYDSPNGSFNHSNNKRSNNGGNRSRDSNTDMSLYYHRSMLEDPWAQLVQEKLRNNCKSSVPASIDDSDIGIAPLESDSD